MKLLYPTSREISQFSDVLPQQAENSIRATMVVGRNGGSWIAGSSAALSNSDDRALYHSLRDNCDAIVVGSQSAHLYNSVTKPVFVLTRKVPLVDALSEVRANGFSRLLCEGGATLLSAMLQEDLIDELFLTISSHIGDIDATRIHGGKMHLAHLASQSGYLFTHYVRPNFADAGATRL